MKITDLAHLQSHLSSLVNQNNLCKHLNEFYLKKHSTCNIYISGPITGYVNENRVTFTFMKDFLTKEAPSLLSVPLKIEPVNPFDLIPAPGEMEYVDNPTRELAYQTQNKWSVFLSKTIHAMVDNLGKPEEKKWVHYMKADLTTLIMVCDMVVVLPGWNESRGAVTEIINAIALHKPVLDHTFTPVNMEEIKTAAINTIFLPPSNIYF